MAKLRTAKRKWTVADRRFLAIAFMCFLLEATAWILLSAPNPEAQGGTCAGGIPCATGWYQVPNTSLTALEPSYADIQGTSGPSAVQSAWGDALVDNSRNRLIITGGGHGDYYGNEVYAIDFNNLTGGNPTPVLVHDASHGSTFDSQLSSGWGQAPLGGGRNNNVACPEAVTDVSGSGVAPNSRHTYGGLQYLPNSDTYFYYGGGLAGGGGSVQCGSFTDGVWNYNPRTASGSPWTQFNLTGSFPSTASNGSIPMSAYNPTDGCVYFLENNVPNFWKNCFDATNLQYTNANEAWTALTGPGDAPCNSDTASATIDVLRQLFVCVGGGNLYTIALSNSARVNDTAATGCSTPAAANGPGVTYDPIQQLVVFWVGGNSVYTYNATAHTCSTVTFAGGPGAELTNGTFHRFSYMPGIGAFVLANGMISNVWTLRLTDPATAALADFNNRVSASSATASQNFDNSSLYVAVSSGAGFWPGTGANPIAVQDTTIARSGASSAEYILPGQSNDRPDGWYALPFGFDLTANSTVYFQFAQRMDQAFITNSVPASGGGTTYWKQYISSWFDGNNNFQSCANPDLVMVDTFNRGYAQAYLACGNDGLQLNSSLSGSGIFDEYNSTLINSGTYNGTTQTLTGGTLGNSLYNCQHGTTQPNANCFDYPANTWVTYLTEVQMGTFGTASSTVSIWVSTPSSPAYRQIIYSPNHVITQDTASLRLNVLQLMAYWTGRDSNTCSTPCTTMHTWYDEAIVSHNFIPAPQAPPVSGAAPAPQPSAPTPNMFAGQVSARGSVRAK